MKQHEEMYESFKAVTDRELSRIDAPESVRGALREIVLGAFHIGGAAAVAGFAREAAAKGLTARTLADYTAHVFKLAREGLGAKLWN